MVPTMRRGPRREKGNFSIQTLGQESMLENGDGGEESSEEIYWFKKSLSNL
jgi:hypothetical protein